MPLFSVGLITVVFGLLSSSSSWSQDGRTTDSALNSKVAEFVLKKMRDYDAAAQSAQYNGQLVEPRRGIDVLISASSRADQIAIYKQLKADGVSVEKFQVSSQVYAPQLTPLQIRNLALSSRVQKINYNFNIQRVALGVSDGEELNFTQDANLPHSTGTLQVEESLRKIGADKVWNKGIKGRGIVVAGQDTGVDARHESLVQSYRGNRGRRKQVHRFSWFDAIDRQYNPNETSKCPFSSSVPCDDNAHGTHTLGTVVGSTSTRVIGVAPDAQWIACRNMDAGFGSALTYLRCFDFFFAPGGNPKMRPHVMNNSWGCPKEEGCQGNEFDEALANLKKVGVFVVVSAGNEGPGCGTMSSPPAANALDAFTVGAYNHRTNRIASFSSRGPSPLNGRMGPDLVAPGVSITSALPGGGYGGSMWSGTSMAGPHVAGVVALMWSANPALIGKVDVTADILRKTADRPQVVGDTCGGVSGSAVPNNTYGYGYVNAEKAVNSALAYQKRKK